MQMNFDEARMLEVVGEFAPMIVFPMTDEEVALKSLELIRSYYSTPHVQPTEPVEIGQ